ncbi:amidase [Pseudomonas sp. ABC1]|uniref:amidase n=1 Tax=Pseudomonas sp. ABC1 TaxID=2748080 RepID=UPI0015C2D385|nr:amidase [Pseudomonas sp. ABC1]QLF93317.1 amidase [Pseudomonas sp. ABC1]
MSASTNTSPDTRSSQQAVEACIERFHQTEERIQAFQWFDEERAREEARFQDQRTDAAPLAGLVIGIKDLIDTADAPATYGSPIYANHRPAKDALIVSRLRQAGAVPFGKTVTTEFALFNPPKTRNPWKLDRTPGGSSSGSAAAVAAGVVPVALGTQTAGSVIRPAAFCGIFGFKPSFDALPADGVKTISPSLDTVGLMARRIEDIQTVFDAVRSERPAHPTALPVSLNIAFMRTPWWSDITPDIRAHVEAAAQRLAAESTSFGVHESPYNTLFGELTTAQQALMGGEVLANLARERRDHAADISQVLSRYLDQVAQADPRNEAAARTTIERVKNDPDLIFGDAHLILSPSTLTEAPTRESTGDPLLCRAWTALGIPSINLPIGFGQDGLPIGLQLAARPGHDDLLLAAASRIAQHLGITTAPTPELKP